MYTYSKFCFELISKLLIKCFTFSILKKNLAFLFSAFMDLDELGLCLITLFILKNLYPYSHKNVHGIIKFDQTSPDDVIFIEKV